MDVELNTMVLMCEICQSYLWDLQVCICALI